MLFGQTEVETYEIKHKNVCVQITVINNYCIYQLCFYKKFQHTIEITSFSQTCFIISYLQDPFQQWNDIPHLRLRIAAKIILRIQIWFKVFHKINRIYFSGRLCNKCLSS